MRRTYIADTTRNNVIMPGNSTAAYDTVTNTTTKTPQAQHLPIGNLGYPSPGGAGTLSMTGAVARLTSRPLLSTDVTPGTLNIRMEVFSGNTALGITGTTGDFTPPALLSSVPCELEGELEWDVLYPTSVTSTWRFNGRLLIPNGSSTVDIPIRNTGISITVPAAQVFARTTTQWGSALATNIISYEYTEYEVVSQEF